MSVIATREFASRASRRDWRIDLGAAAAVVLIAFVVHAFGGFPSLGDARGDNDALLRMVQVRDLIAGQGWFDLHQYRMGLEGGFPMHWSRIVDAPIAGIDLAVWFLTGDMALAEKIASILWPLLLYGAAIFLILRIAEKFGGQEAKVPALVVGGVTLHIAAGLFAPGSLDHHNLQLVLTLALLAGLLAETEDRLAAYGSGASAALMLAIGMETIPYVAIGGLCVAGLFLFGGPAERVRAVRFGFSFGVVALGSFVLTVSPDAWLAPQCDAFSVAQLALAVLGGFGLASVAALTAPGASLARRALGLGALGAAVGLLAGIGFPQCLGDPYAALDPRLRELWLDSVSEAQSVRSVLLNDPLLFTYSYITPLLALGLLASRAVRKGVQRPHVIMIAFLLSAVLVSFWQMRGAMFSMPLAVIPLSAWIGERRARAEAVPTLQNRAGMILAWLLSINLVWFTAAGFAQDTIGGNVSSLADGVDEEECYRAKDYERLAGLPADTVLAVSNLGASILRHTPHRALAGSYHRNVAGNLATFDILMADSGKAQAMARRLGIGLVAHCPGNSETADLAARAPDGLIAELSRNRVPEWLDPVPGTEEATLRLYRIRKD